MKIAVKDVSYHRNGIGGEGFYAVLFDWKDDDGKKRSMIASVFDGSGQCAVYDVQELAAGNIAFACGNSWRGDHFEDEIRKAIAERSTNRCGPFAFPDTRSGAA